MGELGKTKVITNKSRKVKGKPGATWGHLGPYREVTSREIDSELESVGDPGVLTLLELRVGCLRFQIFTLYWQI